MRLGRIITILPKVGSELLLAAGINVVFLIIAALALWPLGHAALAGSIGLGLLVFALAAVVVFVLSLIAHAVFRIEIDPPSTGCVIVNLAASVLLQAGWAAFAALAARGHATGATLLTAIVVYFLGLVASWLGTVVTGAFFQGSVYKSAAAIVSFLGFAVFAFWPGVAHALFGWIFARF